MNVVITIPIGIHTVLLTRCLQGSQVYMLLKGGLLGRDVAADQIVVKILCSAEEAKEIVALVEREYPTGAGEISVKPDPSDQEL